MSAVLLVVGCAVAFLGIGACNQDLFVSTSGASGGASSGGMCDDEPEMPTGACPETCSGGCSDGVCVLACVGAGACRETEFECPEDWNCRVVCTGTEACEDARVQCPSRGTCEVECSGGSNACDGVEITCGDSVCSVSCGEEVESCRDLRLECGSRRGSVSCLKDETIAVVRDDSSNCACEQVGCGSRSAD